VAGRGVPGHGGRGVIPAVAAAVLCVVPFAGLTGALVWLARR